MPINGEEHFCTNDYLCGHHEGDCDHNNQCQNGFKCGTDNCPAALGFGSWTDCCYNQTLLNMGDAHFCTVDNPCEENEGDCGNDNDCQTGLTCGTDNCPASLGFDSSIDCCNNHSSLKNGDLGFCSTSYPCAENEGDCENDNHCQDGLSCGTDNCPNSLGFHSDIDCCHVLCDSDYDVWIGDGFCDDVNNNDQCNWDGGDCCGENVYTDYCLSLIHI